MHLSLPANYDAAILPELARMSVFEIYGKLSSDVVGGGRPSYMATPLSKRNLSGYIKRVHSYGLKFNYLLNSACLGNHEWTADFHRYFNSLLDWICDQGVETVTITIPYLLQVVKKRYPQLKTKVGIYAQVDTVKRARYWADMGADAINIESFSINRDFQTLKAIRKAVDCDLVLIANHFCQPNCPYQFYHQNGHAHASATRRAFLIDWPLMQCQKARLSKPELFISAGWIRPEDIHIYESLGYSTFKLLERNIPSEQLLKRARAYHTRSFSGNWAEMILSWSFRQKPPGFSWFHLVRMFKAWKIPLRGIPKIVEFLKRQSMFYVDRHKESEPAIRIDADKIPRDFLDHFLKSGSCLNRDCTTCGYCGKIAKDAVSIDPVFLNSVMPLYESLNEDLNSGTLWK